MTAIEKEQLLRLGKANRHILISRYIDLCASDKTVIDCGIRLKDYAVEKGYTAPRDLNRGMLVVWLKQARTGERIPKWVGDAAADLLVQYGFEPTTQEELSAFICAWVSAHGPFPGRAAAVSAFPAHLRNTSSLQLLSLLVPEEAPRSFTNRVAILLKDGAVVGFTADRAAELQIVVVDQSSGFDAQHPIKPVKELDVNDYF